MGRSNALIPQHREKIYDSAFRGFGSDRPSLWIARSSQSRSSHEHADGRASFGVLTVPKLIPGADEYEPFSQGSLSRLCGLYSILNAVQLGLYPHRLAPAQRKRLFIAAVGHLGRKGMLGKVLGVGMDEDIWLGLAKAVGDHVENRFGVKFGLRRVITGEAGSNRRQALKSIATAIERRRPVLVYLGGLSTTTQ